MGRRGAVVILLGAGKLTSASLVLLLATIGCSRSDGGASPTAGKTSETATPPSATPPSAPTSSTPPPLSKDSPHCRPAGCRDYAATIAHLRERTGGYCTDASFGQCGAFRYVLFSDGFSSVTEYFDDSGVMIGVRTSADVDPRGTNSGTVPNCAPKPSEVLCGHGYMDAGRR